MLSIGLSTDETMEQAFGPEYGKLDQMIFAHNNSFNVSHLGGQIHPVEKSLRSAKWTMKCSNKWDPEEKQEIGDRLRRQREIVIDYLEPQCKSIIEAASHLNSFVKQEKTPGGLFDAEPQPRTLSNSEYYYRTVDIMGTRSCVIG